MTDCCSPSDKPQGPNKKHKCPESGKLYSSVPASTIFHHISEPWKWSSKDQNYYFCDDPKCDVVYFGEDNSVIYKSSLRTKVGVKEDNPDVLICYCFGISKADSSSKRIKDFVVKNTKEKICACTTRNPSGRCCLKDFR